MIQAFSFEFQVETQDVQSYIRSTFKLKILTSGAIFVVRLGTTAAQ